MTETPPSYPFNDRLEVAAAVVLSLAGLMTSWSGYQAALWDGEQASSYTEAGVLRTMASRHDMDAKTRQAVEAGLFDAWLNAEASGQKELAAFYRDRFPPDFRPAFDAWAAMKPLQTPGAPPSPFAIPQYRLHDREEAARYEQLADQSFKKGQRDNDISDAFVQGAVFLAMAMFFGGIGQVFHLRRVRLALVTVAALSCIVGLVKILALPVLAPG
jgi:hypothetical protein